MKTFTPTLKDIRRKWYIVDAKNKTLGRLATEVARRLRGKHKPEYTPHMDLGDYIIIINSKDVRVTGKKSSDKNYYWHTGYPGGIKSITFDKLIATYPDRVIRYAIKGMLPKGPLGRAMLKKLKIYSADEHHHHAQQPELLEIGE